MPFISDIFDLTPKINTDKSYIRSYPHLLDFFQNKKTITEADFVCGAHMVYGWMPTILDLYPLAPNQSFEMGPELLMRARKDGKLVEAGFESLKGMVNNSLIGASKLLHFVAPDKFPIWDTNIYAFYVLGKRHPEKITRPAHQQVNQIHHYLCYLESLKEIQTDKKFIKFHQEVNTALGYTVSKLRAIELVMFNNAPGFIKPPKKAK